MFTIQLAQINICIDNKYEYIEKMCSDYMTTCVGDFAVSVSEKEIQDEIIREHTDRGYAESLAIYRKIATGIISYNGFLLHGVAAQFKGRGIAFLAPSGTGKSTHASYWKEVFGDDFVYVNGDKPLIRVDGNNIYAYGTPWAGKENLHTNMRTRLEKVCFINRSDTDQCIKMKKTDVFQPLMHQIYIPDNTDNFLTLLSVINHFVQNAEFYMVNCTTSCNAAKTAHEVIFGE